MYYSKANFVTTANQLKKYITNPKLLDGVEDDVANLFEKLIDSEFFKDIASALISPIVIGRESKFDDFKNQKVLGLMLGLSLGRYDIIQYNIKHLTS